MDWEKAKKTFIYLLIALNVLLFATNYFMGAKYKLTQKEEAAVHKVLSDNGMGIYCNLVTENKPMRFLGVSTAEYEADELKGLFFDASEEVQTILEFEQVILESKEKRLEIQDNHVRFYSENGTGEIENFGRQTARDAAEEFVKKIDLTGGKNALEKMYQSGDRYVFIFDETFSGYKVFSNSKRVEVTKDGIVYADAAYYNVGNNVGEKLEICGCDEALLTVMYRVVKDGDSIGRYIEDIEMGYDFQSAGENYDPADIKLVPCYRVYVSGEETPYTVNAYTNEIID